MSELAFDVMGEPVEFPAATEELRVRRFRNPGMRGACELVHDRDGAPLYVSVDTGYLEFRALVDGVPGRYRLDPVGEDRRSIPGAVPAYVTIVEVRNAAKAESSEQESVIRELARANAEMVKVMAERFAEVMQAAAELLRAADGAGLSRRSPAPEPPPRNAVEDEDDEEEDEDEDDDEEDDEKEAQAAKAPDMAMLIGQLMPMLQLWFTTKMAQQAPAPAAQVAPPAEVAVSPPGVGEPAGAEAGSTPRNGDSAARERCLLAVYDKLEPREKRITERALERMATDVRANLLDELSALPLDEAVTSIRSMIRESRPPNGGDARAENRPAPAPAPAPTVAVPTAAAQLMAIYSALAPHEQRIVQAEAARMTPDARAEWTQQLCGMSTADAVALVRSMIPKDGGSPGKAPANGQTPKEGG